MECAAVYLHVPYCLQKCAYCDFVSFPIAGRESQLAAYPDLLLQELALRAKQVDFSGAKTVYFGGGTPSLLDPNAVARLLALFPHAEEITLEANPETVDLSKLQAFRAAGVNRLSFGVQSFDDALLCAMGRAHRADRAKDAVRWAKEAGFANISIDLIYGLPDQTLAGWETDLQQALALDVPHISLYGLSIEPETPWGREGVQPADEDLSADMLELAVSTLKQAGYGHYEISNFARSGWESRHNLAYWQRKNYLGVGVAAAGCLAERRMYNAADLPAYSAALAAGRLPVAEEEVLDMESVMAETVFLALRTAEGLSFARFAALFGVDARKRYAAEIRRLSQAGLLAVDADGMHLTERGMMLGNQAFAAFV